MSDKKAIGGAGPPPVSAPTFTPQPPPQANQTVPTPQPYGVWPLRMVLGDFNEFSNPALVPDTKQEEKPSNSKTDSNESQQSELVPGIPTGSPYVIPGQTQIYPQGPPPTYDQALTHPAIVGQPMYHPGTVYATGYPTYLGYPTYAPMQYYPSLGAYSYAMQPTAQMRPTIMIPNGYDAGARFDGIAQQVIPPAPPGVPPSAAQLAAMAGHQVAIGQKKNSFLAGGSDGGYTFW